MRLALLLLLLPLTSNAQLLGGLFGGDKTPSVTAKWNCPQETYPGVTQLRKFSQVKVKFKDNNGKIKVELDPNLFKTGGPLSFLNSRRNSDVAVDYSECVEEFRKKIEEGVREFKETKCGQDNQKYHVCSSETGALLSALDQRVENEKYFKEQSQKSKLPTILPGSDEVKFEQGVLVSSLRDYCAGGALTAPLSSAQGLEFVSTRSDDDFNKECKSRFGVDFRGQVDALKPSVCGINDAICTMLFDRVSKAQVALTGYVPVIITPPTDSQASTVTSSSGNGSQTENGSQTGSVPQTETNTPTGTTQPTSVVVPGKVVETDIEKEDQKWLKLITLSDKQRDYYQKNFRESFDRKDYNCDFVINWTHFASQENAYSVVADNLNEIEARGDTDCLKGIANKLMTSYSDKQIQLESNPEFKKFCNENPKAKSCTLWQDYLNQRIAVARDVLSRIDKDAVDNLAPECSPFTNETQTLEDFLAKAKNTMKAMSCLDLKTGQTKVVSSKDGAPTGIGPNYALTRRPDGNYDVTIVVNFKGENDGVTPEIMAERAKACINKVTPYMKGPDGTVLNLKLLTASEADSLEKNKRPRTNNISIESNGFRSHSGAYAATADCGTIAHEVLHLLGLCDEYSEKTTVCKTVNGTKYCRDNIIEKPAEADEVVSKPLNDCRYTPKMNTMMNQPWSVIEQTIPAPMSCRCGPNSQSNPNQSYVCGTIMSGGNATLKKLYMMPPFSEITDNGFRNKYCVSEYADNENITYDNSDARRRKGPGQLGANPVTVAINSSLSSGNKLVVDTQEVEERINGIPQERFTCTCPDDDTACLNIMGGLKKRIPTIAQEARTTCPSGTSRFKKDEVAPIPLEELKQKPFHLADGLIWMYRRPVRETLLAPTHFERILGGSCPTKAVAYSECATWAYKTYQNDNCKGMPEYCRNDQAFLGVSK